MLPLNSETIKYTNNYDENKNDNDNDNDSRNGSNKESIVNLEYIQNIQDKLIKPNVVFSSSDFNKVKSFDYNSNSTSQKSFRSKSEISYELFNKMQNECREYYLTISKPFNKYLISNFIMK